MQFTNELADSEWAGYAVGGYGDNAFEVRFLLRRVGEAVVTDITTDVASNVRDWQASERRRPSL